MKTPPPSPRARHAAVLPLSPASPEAASMQPVPAGPRRSSALSLPGSGLASAQKRTHGCAPTAAVPSTEQAPPGFKALDELQALDPDFSLVTPLLTRSDLNALSKTSRGMLASVADASDPLVRDILQARQAVHRAMQAVQENEPGAPEQLQRVTEACNRAIADLNFREYSRVWLQRSADDARSSFDANPLHAALEFATCLSELGRFEDAARVLRWAEAAHPPGSDEAIDIQNFLVPALVLAGRDKEAIAHAPSGFFGHDPQEQPQRVAALREELISRDPRFDGDWRDPETEDPVIEQALAGNVDGAIAVVNARRDAYHSVDGNLSLFSKQVVARLGKHAIWGEFMERFFMRPEQLATIALTVPQWVPALDSPLDAQALAAAHAARRPQQPADAPGDSDSDDDADASWARQNAVD